MTSSPLEKNSVDWLDTDVKERPQAFSIVIPFRFVINSNTMVVGNSKSVSPEGVKGEGSRAAVIFADLLFDV